jgi:translation initiation factor IF-1
MKGIENAAIGHKILMVGELVMKGGQKVLQVLNVVESGLIELAVANGHDLLNKLGKKTRVHVIRSSPGNLASRQVAPQVMHVRKK